jgi:hypothetical protein
MAISRGQLVKELEPGLNALFGLEYKRYENQHAQIFDSENSDRAFEEEVMLSGFANAQTKPEGSAVTFDNAQETFTARYTHETIALAFSITEEAIEDNLYDRLASRYTKALARSMANTKQVKAANVLNNAFDDAFDGGDGVALLSTAHPTIAGTFRNELLTPADLNETSLEQSIIDIAAFTDERGLKIAARAVKMIIPSELQFTAERLMKTQGRVGTADNDIKITCEDNDEAFNNAIVDKVGQSDIVWEESSFYNKRKTWITYEEVNDANTRSIPLQTEEGPRTTVGAAL